MKFANWIEAQGGPLPLSRKINVNQFTVYAWLRGRATPRAGLMVKLVQLGKGSFSLDDIIKETRKGRGIKK